MQYILDIVDGPARVYEAQVSYKVPPKQRPYSGPPIYVDLRRTDAILWCQMLNLHGATEQEEAGFHWQPSEGNTIVLREHQTVALIYEAEEKIPGLNGRIRKHPIDASLQQEE